MEPTPVRVIEDYTRPLGIPVGWIEQAKRGEVELYNAARPFPAHKRTTGEFIHGLFYGLINPAQDYADEYRKRAIELDAHRVVFVSRAEVKDWAKARCAHYGIALGFEDFTYADLCRSYVTNHR